VLVCPLLFSFAYPEAITTLRRFLDKADLILDDVMLDSGAPTVWSKGLHIDIDDFARFILWVRDYKRIKTTTCVALDVLPIKRDQSTVEEIDKCAETSLKNFLYFKELEIDSIAVYHFGENRRWLDKILEHTSHIGLGGMHKLQKKSAHREWLDDTWDYLLNQNIKALKVHGFAQTSISVMQRYDWHSVDSTSALMSAAMGRVYLPGFNVDSSYSYTKCSTLMAGAKHPPQHAAQLNGLQKDGIEAYLKSIGFKYEDLFDHYQRIAINVQFFMDFVEEMK